MAREFPTINIKKKKVTPRKKKIPKLFLYSETSLIYTALTQL